MSIFTKIQSLLNIQARKVPLSYDVRSKLNERYISRPTPDLGRFKSAVASAESVVTPSRRSLITQYRVIDQDSHLTSVCESRDLATLSSPYKICDKDGKELEGFNTFKMPWFRKMTTEYLKAKYWGCTVFELLSVSNEDVKFTTIPREHVIPNKYAIVVESYLTGNSANNDTFFYDRSPYNRSTIAVYDEGNNLGLYFKIAPMVIFKRYALANWSEFAEKYGMPMAIGKTTISDEVSVNKMTDMLANFGSALYGILGTDDSVELLSTSSTDAYNVFLQLIELANKEISKVIVGQTMTTDDGSSRSQAEVHQDIFYNFVQSDMQEFANWVNYELIPRLRFFGMIIPKGAYFKFDSDERLSTLERLQIDGKLLDYYSIPEDYILETYGVPVLPKPTPLQNGNEPDISSRLDIDKYLASFTDFYTGTHNCADH